MTERYAALCHHCICHTGKRFSMPALFLCFFSPQCRDQKVCKNPTCGTWTTSSAASRTSLSKSVAILQALRGLTLAQQDLELHHFACQHAHNDKANNVMLTVTLPMSSLPKYSRRGGLNLAARNNCSGAEKRKMASWSDMSVLIQEVH